MRTRQEILDTLKAYKEEATSKYGITKLGLFGSVARNQQREDSDVDICFDGATPTLITMARMEIELEKRIDTKQYDTFHARFFGRISELLLDVWINTNKLEYKEVRVIDIEKVNWIKKGMSFLMAKFTHKKYGKSF